MDHQLAINVTVKRPASDAVMDLIQVRLFSEWLKCSCTSPKFGEEEILPWKGDEDKKSATFVVNAAYDITSPEKLGVFNEKPGVYVVVLRDSTPLGFTYVDCSSFVLEAGSCFAKNVYIAGYSIDATVTSIAPLLPLESSIKLEPVVLDIKSIAAYPVLEEETIEEAVRSTYVYGEFNMGGGVKRQIIGFPYVENVNASQENTDPVVEMDKMHIGLKICLLPGLIDIPRLKDSFISSTLVLELHREDVFKRAFHQRNVDEYLGMAPATAGVVDAAAAADTGKKGGKAAPPPKKGAPPPDPAAAMAQIEVSEMTPGDSFLLGCILRALSAARQIRPHGTVRYRLEQLLSSSNDLLTRFARMRHGGAPIDGDETVVVKEDLLVEVRLEKPSKPEKWDLPADISLRSALQRAKQETQSKLDGTLAGGNTMLPDMLSKTRTLGGTQKITRLLAKSTPRHEMFLTCNTAVEMTAALHRTLIIPVKEHAPEAKSTPSKQNTPSKAVKSPGKGTPAKSAAPPMPAEDVPLSDLELQKKLAVTPFTRMVVLFRYLDDDTLRAITRGLNAVNGAALPDIQGTLRSYSFSEKELVTVKNAQMDVITGFMIIDDDMRLVVLEGLAAPGKGMQRMFTEFLPRVKQNDESLKIVCNPEILFPDRIYPEFGPDLRRIRIRDKLKKLARRPEVYNRKQVEEICFEAIDSIMTLKRAQDMDSTKKLDMYPTAESLNKLEVLYGEAITRPDMDGTLRDAFVENFEKHARNRAESPPKTPGTSSAEHLMQGTQSAALLSGTGGRMREPYKPTECRNEAFEEHLRTRPVHRIDHLDETKQLRQEAWQQMLRRRERRDEQYETNLRNVLGDEAFEQSLANGGPKIYLYSQQSKNFKSQAFGQLRDRIAQDKNATYTFSQDFVSQTVCVVDEEQLVKRQKEEVKAGFLTAKGFQYPKPKTSKELLLHPQRPSEARIEDLKEPFRDILDVRPGADSETRDPELRALEKGFKTQLAADGLFGSLKPVTFERPFELKLVGDRSKLPRGKLTGGTEPDPQAFRSVHLGGENQARIIAEAAAQEKKEWRDKIVVDNLTVQVGGFKIRDKPLQVNRTTDILKDEPKRQELIHLRNRVSHRGDDWGYHTAPLSILNAEPYIQNQATNALLRTADPSKFITSTMLATKRAQAKAEAKESIRMQTGGNARSSTSIASSSDTYDSYEDKAEAKEKPLDFTRYIHKDTFNPKLMSVIARRKHPPQDRNSDECKGPKWEPAGSK